MTAIACLILGYNAAPVLARSAPILAEAGLDIFLHVDRKTDLAAYVGQLGQARGLCRLLDWRVEVFWGGFSMVRATLALIEDARICRNYDKFLLISDDSFPAFPARDLAGHFATATDQITVREQAPHSPYWRHYQGFFCHDHPATTARQWHGFDPITAREVDFDLVLKISEIAGLQRDGKKKLSVFFGPQFWALTRNSVELVLQATRDAHLMKSFEYSALPDELFFHSILGNYGGLAYAESAPVYADHSGGGPRTISGDDSLPLDLNPPHAFIRKIAPEAAGFIDTIAGRLRQGLSIWGHRPGAALGAISWIDNGGQAIRKVRLCAPEEGLPGWHGLELLWGRRYRWTATSRLSWDVCLPADPGLTRFVVTTATAAPWDWVVGCRLAVGGEVRPVAVDGGELRADFEGLSGPTVVELLTPEPREPPPWYPDKRHLGLAVAV